MHIFFWFFKQLYYLLKHFKLKNFLLLLAFFIIAFFLFIKPTFASTPTTLDSFNYNGSTYYFDYPLTLTNTNNSYYLFTNSDFTTIYVIEPYGTNYTLDTWTNLQTNNMSTITNLSYMRGISSSNSHSDVIIYQCSHNNSNNSFSSWSNTTSSNFVLFNKNTNYNYQFITGSNVSLFTQLADNSVFLINDSNLPNNIKLTDNIAIISRTTNNTGFYLLYTNNLNNKFTFNSDATIWTCKTLNNNDYQFDVYEYSNNSWNLLQSDITTFNTNGTSNTRFWYNYNNIKLNNTNYNTGYFNFFNFYYDIQPYIENNLDTITNWTFNTLTINGGNYINNSSIDYLYMYYPDINTYYTFDISSYKTYYNGSCVFNVPRSLLNENIVIRSGSQVFFELVSTDQVERWYYS